MPIVVQNTVVHFQIQLNQSKIWTSPKQHDSCIYRVDVEKLLAYTGLVPKTETGKTP